LSLLCLAFAAHPKEQEFAKWMKQYNKVYVSEVEYNQKFLTYLQSVEIVAELNKNPHNVTYELNQFADYTQEEFSRLLGAKISNIESEPLENAPLETAPASHDWCSQGKCTPVKDQGQCGSCWAFATTENIESVLAIRGEGLKVLAPQQIVDCDRQEAGCGGGDPSQAYKYVVSQGGLDTEQSYPYVGVQGGCRFNRNTVGGRIAGERNGYGGSEENMAANLASTAPFSIIVDAQQWQYYKGGILKSSQCGKSLDHAVVAVGYNLNEKYWRVRNSWGRTWGEDGFIRLEFGTNTCGLTTQVLTSVA